MGFKQRQHLAIRSPEATSLGRATAFNRHTVNEFYDNLAQVMDANQFRPEDIHNLDETGCTTVQNPKDIVTEIGKKQVGSATSAERGTLVTVVYTINAAGNVLPPMFIFPRKNFRDHFNRGGRPGCIGQANKSGWINEELFLVYRGHLIRHTRCSKERKVLLILDNHELHISIHAIELARANGIVMLTIPPHTSHRLQPLDRTVFGPFKSSYNRSMDGWLRSNPGKTVTIYEIPSLVTVVKEAQLSAMTTRNILSGFQHTGIFPLNRELFAEADFEPATLTNRDIPDVNPMQLMADIPNELEANTSTTPIEVPQVDMIDSHETLQPGTSNSHAPHTRTIDAEIARPSTSATGTCVAQSSYHTSDQVVGPPGMVYVSPGEIHSVPKAGSRKTKRSRKKGNTKIFTSTPV